MIGYRAMSSAARTEEQGKRPSMERPSNAATRLARLIGAIVLLTSLLVLAGWAFRIPAVTSILPGWPRMAALTASAFGLASVSLWFALPPPTGVAQRTGHGFARDRRQQLSLACASLVALIGLVRLVSHVFGWNVGLSDSFAPPNLTVAVAGSLPASMSPATGLAFALLGGALLLKHTPRLTRVSQALSVLALLVGWLGFARYVFGGVQLVPFTAMAIHTALIFVILSVGVLSLCRDRGLTVLLLSEGAGGASARHLLPAALLIPLGAGALALSVERAGRLGTEGALSLFALASVLVFAGLVWANAAQLEHADRERRLALEALRASEERVRLIIETALDAVITIDYQGVISGWSARAEALFGWARAEAIGHSLAETIIPERHREAHQRGLRRYLETGEARVLGRRVELSALHRDRQEFPVEIAITPIRGGEEVSFSAFVRDITERVRAEAALRESQQLLQSIVDNSQAVIYVKDLDGRYLLVNRRFEEIFSLSRESVLGRTDHHFFSKEAADTFRAMDVRVAAADRALTEEETVPQVDGSHVYISLKAPLKTTAGKTCGVFGISTDITHRKLDEQRLRTQLARLNLLDETTRAIGERVDLHSIFQVVIRRLEDHLPIDFGCACLYDPVQQMLSVTCVGVKSQALALQLALTERARIVVDENGLGRCVRGELVYEPDFDASGVSFPARLAKAGMRSLVFAPLVVENKVVGILMVARRQTRGFTSSDCEFLRQLSGHVALAAHQSQLYAALQCAYEDLRQTQQTVMQQERVRALAQMASGIAHDINNALSPAALYVQSLLDHDRLLGAEARDYLVITQRAIEDVSNTVARMREFYRPREPQVTLVTVDLNRVLQQVIELTRARWSDIPQERGILIRVQCELTQDLRPILGAESEIRDALTNLVFNAVDAMPEGGTLTLRTHADGATTPTGTDVLPAARVLLEVCDTGIGMDEGVRSRCLEPFFTTKGERGTGLGLAMVYGMIQRHSAELEIDSAVGHGTTVRLSFVAAQSASPGAHYQVPAMRTTRRLRLLLVDDDPQLAKALQEILEGDGHNVTVADGGQKGIDTFLSACQSPQSFSLVITDLGMPYVDGRTVAAAVKATSPDTPVIMLTGWGKRMLADTDVPPHIDRLLSKPPKLVELRAALADLAGDAKQPAIQEMS
jgi:PAS domain S-box-containing protein